MFFFGFPSILRFSSASRSVVLNDLRASIIFCLSGFATGTTSRTGTLPKLESQL
jgi:hypothetical protein